MENRYKIVYDLKQRLISNIRFMQGDKDSSVIEVTLVDGGMPVNIMGEWIEFRFLKPDKTIVYQDGTTGVSPIDTANGKVECVLMSNTLAAPGLVKCEIHRQGMYGEELTTPTFSFTVGAGIGDSGVLSSNYITEIDRIKNDYLLATTQNTDVEIVAARGGEVNLDTRLTKADNDLLTYKAETATYCNSVSDMKADTKLKLGMTAVTHGYYSANDGGGATYTVLPLIGGEVENGFRLMSNEFTFEMILDGTVNFKSLGARGFDDAGLKVDSTPFLQNYINRVNYHITPQFKLILFMPAEPYFFSPLEFKATGVYIQGVAGFDYERFAGTMVMPFVDAQPYIWRVGTYDVAIGYSYQNINIYDITFSSYNMINKSTMYGDVSLEELYYCERMFQVGKVYGADFKGLNFFHFKGGALEIMTSYEMYFDKMHFRGGYNPNGNIINFKEDLTGIGNISACHFGKIMFESIVGDPINFEGGSKFINSVFGTINFEAHATGFNGDVNVYTTLPDAGYVDETAVHNALFVLQEGAYFDCIVNNLSLNNLATRYYTIGSTQYIYDVLIDIKGIPGGYVNCAINNVDSIGMKKDMRMIRYNMGGIGKSFRLKINNIMNADGTVYKYYIDTDGINGVSMPTQYKLDQQINGFKNFADYYMYKAQIITVAGGTGSFCGVSYDATSLADNNMVVKLLNRGLHPISDDTNVIIPMVGKVISFRAKIGTNSFYLQLRRVVDGVWTTIHTRHVVSATPDVWKWYTEDFTTYYEAGAYLWVRPEIGVTYANVVDVFYIN